MTESKIQNVLQQTAQNIDLVDEGRKKSYAREAGGLMGWLKSFFGGYRISDYRAMIDGKNLITKTMKK